VRRLLAVSAIAWVCTAAAGAQELRGRIVGTVRDSSGGVVPGVSVTLAGASLLAPQVVLTGARGTYVFPSVPPGHYDIVFEVSGFQTVRREAIRVNLNVTLTIDVDLTLAEIQEALTIVRGVTPVVDFRSTSTAVNFTEELLEDIPNARDIWAVMAQAPGFQMNGYDVGGSHAGTQTGYITYGAESQNRTLLEGINVTEDVDLNAGYFDYGSFEEYQLGGAGNQVETHGIGAFHNITVRSGGDELRADVYYDYVGDGMVANNVPPELEPGASGDRDGFVAPSGGVNRGNPIDTQWDFNAGLGGPLVRGKAWWFFSYRKYNQDQFVFGLPQTTHTELVNYSLKGNWLVNDNNQIIAFWNRRTKFQPERGLGPARPINAAHWQSSVNKPAKLEWLSMLSDNALLDVQGSWWQNEFPLFPTQTEAASGEGVDPGRLDRADGQFADAAFNYYHFRDTQKPQLTGSLSYYIDDARGSHSLKLGGEWYRERREYLRFQPHNQFYYDSGGEPQDVDIYNTPNNNTNDATLFSLWFTDSWTVSDRLTFNLGLRYDRYAIGWPEQSIEPELAGFAFESVRTPATTTNTLNGLGPRIGVAWDVTGEGRTVAKAFFGRFYSNPSTAFVDAANPVSTVQLRYTFNDLDGNRVLTPGPCGELACSPELGPLQTTIGGGGSRQVDPDLSFQYGQEASLAIEHELRSNLSVRANFVTKSVSDGWGEVDVARVDEYTIPFSYQDAGDDNISGTRDDQEILLHDRPAGVGSERLWTNPAKYDGIEAFGGEARTFEVALNKRFSDRWMFLTSYLVTTSNDFRDTTQASTSPIEAMRTALVYNWERNLQENYGRQDSRFWNFKAVGRYVLPFELGISTSYKLQSGYNYARSISVRLPNAGTEAIHATPIADHRADDVGIWDLRVDYTLPLGARGRLTLMGDVYNVLNSNPVVNFRAFSGSRYKEVIALVDPRVFRLGVRFEF
jgi:outer membrane receptor protein involved in Fe transport